MTALDSTPVKCRFFLPTFKTKPMDKPLFNVGENCTRLTVEDDLLNQRMQSVTFSFATFSCLVIGYCDFTCCHLRRAYFDYCEISHTIFDGCNLDKACFDFCNFENVFFKDCTGITADTFKGCTFISCSGHEGYHTPEQTSQNKLFKTLKQVQRNGQNKSHRPF